MVGSDFADTVDKNSSKINKSSILVAGWPEGVSKKLDFSWYCRRKLERNNYLGTPDNYFFRVLWWQSYWCVFPRRRGTQGDRYRSPSKRGHRFWFRKTGNTWNRPCCDSAAVCPNWWIGARFDFLGRVFGTGEEMILQTGEGMLRPVWVRYDYIVSCFSCAIKFDLNRGFN